MIEKRLLRPTPVLLGLSLLALVGCGGDHQTIDESREEIVVRARLAQAERSEVAARAEISGSVEADRTAAISARVMAMVTSIHVQMGDEVRKGQLLLEIDPQTAQGQLSQARGALGQAKAALALAERNHERFKALAETGAASELELDMARMQYEQSLGAVEQAEGAVASASSMADDSRVTAPFAGRVVRRMVEVGDLAAPGRPLMMLEGSGRRRLVVPVAESLVVRSGVSVGDTFQASIDSRPDLGEMIGTVVEMTPGADPASHSYLVKLELPAIDIPTGATGRVWARRQPRAVVTIPSEAMIRRGGMSMVVVRTADGTAGSRVVTLGRSLPEGRMEVLSGLNGGETLLVGLAAVPPVGATVEEVTR